MGGPGNGGLKLAEMSEKVVQEEGEDRSSEETFGFRASTANFRRFHKPSLRVRKVTGGTRRRLRPIRSMFPVRVAMVNSI